MVSDILIINFKVEVVFKQENRVVAENSKKMGGLLVVFGFDLV